MSNVIELLERMGQDPGLRSGTAEDVERHLEAAGIDPVIASLLRTGDQRLLEELLGAKSNLCCLIRTPDDDDDEEEKPDQDDDDAAEEIRLSRSISLVTASHRAVSPR